MGQCPRCGAGYNEGDTFCGSCGNDLRVAQRPAVPMPVPPQQPAYPPQPYPAQQQPAYGQAPAKKKRTGLVIGIVAGVLVLCGACSAAGVVGYLWFIPAKNAITKTETSGGPATSADSGAPAASGDATGEAQTGAQTSLEALKARLPEGWVYELTAERPTMKAYRAGPPASEWASAYVVEKGSSGWTVTSEEPYNAAEGEPAAQDDSKAAADLVKQFRTAIKEGRTSEAQAMTIDPLHSDPASAEYANGEFVSFTIDKTEVVGDGTYWVYDTEKWKTYSAKWKFHVAPTEAGLRINELTDW